MLRYEATNSHNYTWIAELRPDFDMFRVRERKHTSSRLEMLATNHLTDVSVNYFETVEKYTGYMKLIFVECNGNIKSGKVSFEMLNL